MIYLRVWNLRVLGRLPIFRVRRREAFSLFNLWISSFNLDIWVRSIVFCSVNVLIVVWDLLITDWFWACKWRCAFRWYDSCLPYTFQALKNSYITLADKPFGQGNNPFGTTVVMDGWGKGRVVAMLWPVSFISRSFQSSFTITKFVVGTDTLW